MSRETELIVALDVDTDLQAMGIIKTLHPTVTNFKIGSVLFTKYGTDIINCVPRESLVMLDLKYHDIPNTVEKACYNAATLADLITIHLSGGSDMIKAAKAGVKKACKDFNLNGVPKIIGISLLTSIDEKTLNSDLNIDLDPSSFIQGLISMGIRSGIDGIVCSGQETATIREDFGNDLIIINPGIRLNSESKEDQKRVVTPSMAKKSGADFIVMGRSIYNSKDPLKTSCEVIKMLS